MSSQPDARTELFSRDALHGLQRRFVADLFAAAPEDAGDPGVAIYINNLREGFRKALALEFPVVEKLVGIDCFRALARDFQDAYPSRRGDLHHVGESFAHWLDGRFATTEHAYLPDVARLEWAREVALVAANAPAFDVGTLRAVDPARYETLRFTLHPATALVASLWPIVRIWRSNQTHAAEEMVDLDSGGDHVLVHRASDDVEFHQLDRATFLWLDALAHGCTLGEATTIASATASHFDLGHALHFACRIGAFTKEPQ